MANFAYIEYLKDNDVYDSDGNKKDIGFSKSIFEIENTDYRISTLVNNDVTYYGIEDKQGKTLVENNYNYIEYAFGDYFIAENKKEKYGVINGKGEIVLEIKSDSMQKIKNKNIIQVLSKKNNAVTLYSSKLEEIISFCKQQGLAFFDTSSAIRRLQDNASDKFLEVVEPTDIHALLQRLPHLKAIVTTGEKATETICTSLRIPVPDKQTVRNLLDIVSKLFG